MNTPIRVASIGLGWVALNRHLPALDRSPKFDVVGVIDRRPERASAVAGKRGYARHWQGSDIGQIPWIGEIDALAVATPPMAHFEIIRDALALGKHVLTEKPFTMSVEQGATLVAQADAANRRLAIVHNFQFARSTKRLFADLASGALGDVVGIDAVQFGNPDRRLPEWYGELPFGLFYDESPHLLYLLKAVAGELAVTRAFSFPSQLGNATPARVEAWFDGSRYGCPIRLSCNFESPVSEWYLMVSGTKGLGIVDVFRDIYIRLPNDGSHDTWTVLRTSAVATAQHWLQHVTSGIPHLLGRLSYGNDELFDRFARGIAGDADAMRPIDANAAQSVLELQHTIINRAESLKS